MKKENARKVAAEADYYLMKGNDAYIVYYETDEFWDESWGSIGRTFARPMRWAERVPPHYFPKSGYLEPDSGALTALFATDYFFCSEVGRSVISKFEGDRHKFHPFKMRKSVKSSEAFSLYMVNIVDPVDAIDVEASTAAKLEPVLGNPSKSRLVIDMINFPHGDVSLKLRYDKIGDRHFLKGPGIDGPSDALISAEMRHALAAADPGIEKQFNFYPVEQAD